MNLYHLRHVTWQDSQLIYHAQPLVGMEAINILAPSTPYFCIGYHQDLEQEVDVAYCEKNHIPIFRREVGGGAVYLDGNQIFYQIVLHKDNPLAQGDKLEFYQRLLQPVADTYTELGVPATYRPVNDLVTKEGRKISGNGAATMGDYFVLVGNLIADFNYEVMTRVLRVPDEKYRDKVFKSMTENLTTLKRELGHVPNWDEMATPLIRHFEKVLGPLTSAELPQEVTDKVAEIRPRFETKEWLYKKGKQQTGRDVRISSAVNIIHRMYKAPGGLIKATLEQQGDHLESVSLSGDFFCYPEESISDLETILNGKTLSEIPAVLSQFYASGKMDTPGVTVDDWMKVLNG
jgi:lipoate-protein ligase A